MSWVLWFMRLVHYCLWEVLSSGFRTMPNDPMVEEKFDGSEEFELHTTLGHSQGCSCWDLRTSIESHLKACVKKKVKKRGLNFFSISLQCTSSEDFLIGCFLGRNNQVEEIPPFVEFISFFVEPDLCVYLTSNVSYYFDSFRRGLGQDTVETHRIEIQSHQYFSPFCGILPTTQVHLQQRVKLLNAQILWSLWQVKHQCWYTTPSLVQSPMFLCDRTTHYPDMQYLS